MLKRSEGAGVKYVLRPVLARGVCAAEAQSPCALLGTGGRLQLPGYGVEMAVKNMEYSAMDDSKASCARSASVSDCLRSTSRLNGRVTLRCPERDAIFCSSSTAPS